MSMEKSGLYVWSSSQDIYGRSIETGRFWI